MTRGNTELSVQVGRAVSCLADPVLNIMPDDMQFVQSFHCHPLLDNHAAMLPTGKSEL